MCLVVALIALLLFNPVSASPSVAELVTSQNGEIAFASVRDGGVPRIFTMDSDGGNVTRLVALGGSMEPAWSKDGSRLAFVNFGIGNGMQGLKIAEGFRRPARWLTKHSLLARKLVTDRSPSWSPDGRRVVFQRLFYPDSRSGPRSDLFVIEANGRNLRRLVAGGKEPDWSPDGRRIAFTSGVRGLGEKIYVYNLRAATKRRISGGAGDDASPNWSPDGKQLAFASLRQGRSGLYVINADGTGQRGLPRTLREYTTPAWAPDGREIAVAAKRVAGTSLQIFLVDSREKGDRQLTDTVGLNIGPAWRPWVRP